VRWEPTRRRVVGALSGAADVGRAFAGAVEADKARTTAARGGIPPAGAGGMLDRADVEGGSAPWARRTQAVRRSRTPCRTACGRCWPAPLRSSCSSSGRSPRSSASCAQLVEDVDERLATGEQVERVATEVRALSARVEARLDAAARRVDELAERIHQATALVGQAAQDLVEAVVAGVAERLEAQVRAADATSSVAELVEGSERRLTTHVDDAVVALAEVVLRRRRPAASGQAPADHPPADDDPPTDPEPPEPEQPEPEQPEPEQHPGTPDPPAPSDLVAEEPGPGLADPRPGDGFVLVPADVEDADAEPAPGVQQERRTADRRGQSRGDGSGRRRRPWWREV
jgi:hypothetical protein